MCEPSTGGAALAVYLLGPVFVLGFDQRFVEHSQLFDIVPGVSDVPAARGAKGACEIDNRFGPGETVPGKRSGVKRQRGGVRPAPRLNRIARRNRRKGVGC